MENWITKQTKHIKISIFVGIKLASILNKDFNQNIICLMPTNIYGENDNFDIK